MYNSKIGTKFLSYLYDSLSKDWKFHLLEVLMLLLVKVAILFKNALYLVFLYDTVAPRVHALHQVVCS